MTTSAMTVLANALAGHVARTGQPVAELAAELGVSAETVRAWLAGHRPGETDNEFAHLDTAAKLGVWLRARITDSGYTVRQIADSTDNVSMGTVYNWLRGEHLPPPPSGHDIDRFDLLLSNPKLGLNLRQRLQLDEIRRRLTGTSTRPAGPDRWQARGLPGATRDFTGRAPELARLNRLLREYSGSTTAVVAALTGIGGVGKTALAVHWARSRPVRATLTDGCLYLNLTGYADTPPISPDSALAKLLLQLGVRPQDIPADPDARRAKYQQVLTGRKLLVVLDNAHAEPQLRPLLPADPGCLTIVTSRNRLHGLAVTDTGVHRIPLDTLGTTEAASLLRNLLGRSAARTATDEIDALAAACGRLPLALRIAAANYLTHHAHGTSIGDFAAGLIDDGLGRLAVGPSDPATTVTAALDRSYRHLSTAAKRAYRLLGLHPGTDVTTAAAASLTGSGIDAALAALTELTHANLLDHTGTDRYTIHDLLRDHAASLSDRVAADDAAAQRRMIQHYLHTAHAGSLLLAPQRHPIALPTCDDTVSVTAPADPAEVLAWFDTHAAALVALVERCAEHGDDASCWRLAWTLTPYLDRRAQGRTWATVQRLALTAAERASRPDWRAASHRMLGRALTSLGQYEPALARLRDAFAGFERLDDVRGQAATLKSLGHLEHRLGRDRDAVDHNVQALDRYRRLGDAYGEADSLNNLGWCLAKSGRHAEARDHCLAALRCYRDLDQPDAIANTLDSLGYIANAGGHHDSAVHYYGRALAIYENIGGFGYETARGHHRLADQLRRAGDDARAHDHYARALALFDGLQHRDADVVRARIAETGGDAG